MSIVVSKAPRSADGVYIFSTSEMPWSEAGKKGLYQKNVRVDQEKGLFLGLLAFDPFMRTGLHQHQDVAISFFLEGGLTDYQGTAHAGQAGINLAGATHDAIADNRCVIASRLEGGVIYLPDDEPLHSLHAGARKAEIVHPSPEIMPDINITVDDIPGMATSIPHVRRQMIFDYNQTPSDYRFNQLQLLPGAAVPVHRIGALVEWYVRGGAITINGQTARAGDFVILEPGCEVDLRADYGCLLLAWSEGPMAWADGVARPDLYGF
ncbi:MAG: anti-sigma factor [Pseudomonadota bacterium]